MRLYIYQEQICRELDNVHDSQMCPGNQGPSVFAVVTPGCLWYADTQAEGGRGHGSP
jgi:hypothetical protein